MTVCEFDSFEKEKILRLSHYLFAQEPGGLEFCAEIQCKIVDDIRLHGIDCSGRRVDVRLRPRRDGHSTDSQAREAQGEALGTAAAETPISELKLHCQSNNNTLGGMLIGKNIYKNIYKIGMPSSMLAFLSTNNIGFSVYQTNAEYMRMDAMTPRRTQLNALYDWGSSG